MSTIDRTIDGTLDFFDTRLADWTTYAEQLGLSLDDIATLSALLSDAQSKATEAKKAWNGYRAKVDAQNEAVDDL